MDLPFWETKKMDNSQKFHVMQITDISTLFDSEYFSLRNLENGELLGLLKCKNGTQNLFLMASALTTKTQ